LETTIAILKSEKEALQQQFNGATEKLTLLSALVEELKPIKEQYEREKFEEVLTEKQKYFSAKFEAVKSKEIFETKEVQDLIKLSIQDNEEGKNALLQLNTMLVDLVVTDKTLEKKPIKELSSKVEKLIPINNSFDDRYK
jgi:hydrogenase maturation factor HypF (carbamoyltransferase family)